MLVTSLWICWISCRLLILSWFIVALAISLESMAHRQNGANLSLFQMYYFGRCSFELDELVPLPHFGGRPFVILIITFIFGFLLNSFPKFSSSCNSIPCTYCSSLRAVKLVLLKGAFENTFLSWGKRLCLNYTKVYPKGPGIALLTSVIDQSIKQTFL